MFKRKESVFLQVDDAEYRLIRDSLLRWRNKLVAQGRYADPINDLLCKMFTC